MRRFFIFTKAMTLVHVRALEVLFWNFAFPVFLLIIYGAIMRDYVTWLVPGVIVLNALSFGLVGSSSAMMDMREKGILRRLRATPLPAGQLVTAYLVVNMVVGLLQAGLILATARLLYNAPLTAEGLLLALPMIIITALTFVALGGVISGVASKTGVATGIGMTVYFGLMFISDMIFPVGQLPEWMQSVSPYLPPYPAAQLVRSPLLEGIAPADWPRHLALLIAYAVLATVVAARLFRWDPKA